MLISRKPAGLGRPFMMLLIVIAPAVAGCSLAPHTGGISSRQNRDQQTRATCERLAGDAERLEQPDLSETLRIVADAIAQRHEGPLAEARMRFAAGHLNTASGVASHPPLTVAVTGSEGGPSLKGAMNRPCRKAASFIRRLSHARPAPGPRHKIRSHIFT